MNAVDPTGKMALTRFLPYVPAALEVANGAANPGPPENLWQGFGALAKQAVTEWIPNAGKWYLDTVDKNVQKRMDERFMHRD
ncbi:MAG: hypothetical protein AB7D51_09090 [Desulfovibrionaceae bacterium]